MLRQQDPVVQYRPQTGKVQRARYTLKQVAEVRDGGGRELLAWKIKHGRSSPGISSCCGASLGEERRQGLTYLAPFFLLNFQ